MAITPGEAAGLSAQEKETLAKCERYIDTFLQDYYQGGENVVSIPITALSKYGAISNRVLLELARMYVRVGWAVSAGSKTSTSRMLDFKAAIKRSR